MTSLMYLKSQIPKSNHELSHQIPQITEVNNDEKSGLLLLPHGDLKGEKIISPMTKFLKSELPCQNVAKISIFSYYIK